MARFGKMIDIPWERDFEWRIEDFSKLSTEVNKCYESPLFYFANAFWYLQIYPNGQEKNKSIGYISVYLFRKSFGRCIRLDFSLILKTMDERTDRVNHTSYVFRKANGGWGWPEFLKRSEFLESRSELGLPDVLTVICTMKHAKSTDDTNKSVTDYCCHCGKPCEAETISFHERKCLYKPIKCPECCDVIQLRDWFDHECQKSSSEEQSVMVECSHCKKPCEAETISFHEEKCLDKPIKCPECCDVVPLRDWYDHECQKSESKGQSVTDNCSHCKKTSEAETIAFQERKLLDKPMKCPECSDWYDPKCQKSGSKAFEKMSQDFEAVLLSGDHSDFTISVKGTKFHLHRSILAARNNYFHSMFKNDMKEKNTGVASIEDCEPDTFRILIQFIYTGKIDGMTIENVCDLYEMVDKYQEDQFKEECIDFMMKTFCVISFCDYIALSLKYDEKKLFVKAVEFFISNVKEIVPSAKWQIFMREYPTQANELFLKSINHYVE